MNLEEKILSEKGARSENSGVFSKKVVKIKSGLGLSKDPVGLGDLISATESRSKGWK